MYPKFIEIHDGLQPMSINVDQIDWFADETISLRAEEVRVHESYDEIKHLIESTGALIHKGDPRLDTSHPLTMEDLCELKMVGEPVWNSNTLRWMLIIDSALDSRSWVDLLDHCGKTIRYEPHDVQKYPLYRMRGDNHD